ncbi:hypothetical protein K402DRAFT_404598 [Aulographum hederae CBS 113979]|uniref:Uncharacterized protein n=1 Tax=Aulographum hederae CBS 113979 TaxID=1176131 RepID=A0A6G1GZE6_9PEZI|nr:hypothetical protein K402DRAFT_404598 [Aulographum hederae CBS 113979]
MDQICYYDKASRGPIGSLQFIFKYQMRHIGSMGAVTMVLAAVLFPFFQQTIKYQLRSIVDDDQQAMTVAASSWNVTGTGSAFSGSPAVPNAYLGAILPYNIRAAVYSGLMSGGAISLPDPPFACPSGNCTWDPYSTLAFNVQCVDRSQEVRLDCGPEVNPGSSSTNSTDPASCRLAPTSDMMRQLLVGSHRFLVMSMEATLGRWARNDAEILKPFADISTIIQLITWVKTTGQLQGPKMEIEGSLDSDNERFTWVSSNTTYEAKTCAIYLALQDISSRVSQGLYQDEILRECRQVKDAAAFRLDTVGYNGTFFNAMDVFGPQLEVYYESDLRTDAGASAKSFMVTPWSWRALGDMFTGTIMPGGYSTLNANVTFGTRLGAIGNTDVVSMLFSASNTTQVFVNTAAALTNAIRGSDTLLQQAQALDGSVIALSEAAQGHTLVKTQFVEVQFAWLILPIVCWILAAIFLILTIVYTNGGPVGPWKSSPLALLLHVAFDDELLFAIREEHAQRLRSEEGIEEVASKLQARIDKDLENSLILVGQKTVGRD